MSASPIPTPDDRLRERARALGLFGLLSKWEEFPDAKLVGKILDAEEEERSRRSLERRLKNARIGRFKPIADFDWAWPKKIDRDEVEDMLSLVPAGRGRSR